MVQCNRRVQRRILQRVQGVSARCRVAERRTCRNGSTFFHFQILLNLNRHDPPMSRYRPHACSNGFYSGCRVPLHSAEVQSASTECRGAGCLYRVPRCKPLQSVEVQGASAECRGAGCHTCNDGSCKECRFPLQSVKSATHYSSLFANNDKTTFSQKKNQVL